MISGKPRQVIALMIPAVVLLLPALVVGLLLPSYTLAARLLSIESPWQFPLSPDGG